MNSESKLYFSVEEQKKSLHMRVHLYFNQTTFSPQLSQNRMQKHSTKNLNLDFGVRNLKDTVTVSELDCVWIISANIDYALFALLKSCLS